MASLPQVFECSPQQLRWAARQSARRVDHFLLVEFSPKPGARPQIYIQNSNRLPRPRGPFGINYVDDLISNFLLHPQHYRRHEDLLSRAKTLIVLLQIGDGASPIPQSLGFCTRYPQVTLIPDPYFWAEHGYFNLRQEFQKLAIPWKDRRPIAFWRGSSTGPGPFDFQEFQALPRFQLCAKSVSDSVRDLLDARLTNIVQARSEDEASRVKSFAESLGIIAPYVPPTEFLKYRYLIDIDGNTNSWGLLPKLMMGSCVLKVESTSRQWYYDDLRPWEHYIPIRADLSDLEEMITWCREHDDDARHIAESGKLFASQIRFTAEMERAAKRVLDTALAPSADPPPFSLLSMNGSETIFPRTHSAIPEDAELARVLRDLPDTLEYTGDFGRELICFLPTVYWLFRSGLLGNRKVLLYEGMQSIYYFLPPDQIIVKAEERRFIPPRDQPPYLANPHEHLATAKPTAMFPDFRRHFAGISPLNFSKPLCVIHNEHCGGSGDGPANYLSLEFLDTGFARLKGKFQIIYFRQALRQNAQMPFPDNELLARHPEVLVFDELLDRYPQFDSNTLKNLIFSKTHFFISPQSGATLHAALYSDSLLAILHRGGAEVGAYAEGFYRFASNPAPLLLICGSDEQLTKSLDVLLNSEIAGGRLLVSPAVAEIVNELQPVKVPDTGVIKTWHPIVAPDLRIDPFDDGYMVYRAGSEIGHRLNASAGVLLDLCDGSTPETELPALVQQAFGLHEPPVHEVMACLESLRNEGLVS